jgi:uncharacterized protein involved in exopolysaccharide biosynthesis
MHAAWMGDAQVSGLHSATVSRQEDGQVDLLQLVRMLWHGRWLVIGVGALVVAAGGTYAFMAEKWYRAEVVLSPAEKKSLPSNLGQLGGLVSLAGISIGSSDTTEPLAILKSRDFAREFIADLNLLPVLFHEDWDRKSEAWKQGWFKSPKDLRDGVRYFDENVRSVVQDRKTGLITLAVEWTDPEVAAKWANQMARRINEKVRLRATQEAERNIAYLRMAAEESGVLSVQQAMGRLLESEMQKLMVARGSEEFAFKVVDGAVPPKFKSWPRRSIILVASAVLGGILGMLAVFLRHFLRLAGEQSRSVDRRAAHGIVERE